MSNEVYIGTPNSPFPYVGKDGHLQLLADDFTYIKLPTLFTGDEAEIQKRVIGMMLRNLPTRGRLNSFMKNLRRRSSNLDADQEKSLAFINRQLANLVLGNPGSGKTYQAKLLGKMVSDSGAIYVNCKDLDFKNLIVKTVLDTSNIDVEKNAIDARIKMYNKGDKDALSADGIKLLQTMFENAFSTDENGKISLDWSSARNNTSFTSSDRDKEFVSLLQQFCKRERIEYSHNINSVGFIEKDGPLVEALESGKPIILDEINRGKNQDFLLPYLDFFNGGYDSMDIEAANGRVIHLTKESIPPTFMLEAIGNPETLEMGIKEKMSEPLKDRFNIEKVDDFTPKDFTDMFCTSVTGVPISIIKEAYDIKDDKELAQVCMAIRTMGLNEKERRAIPEDQITYIQNAAQFLQAAECVGGALYDLYGYKKQCENSSVCEDPKLRAHIRGQTFSYRIIEDIINRTRTYIPEIKATITNNPFLNYSFEKPKGQNTMQMRMQRQGEGLEYSIEQVTKEMFYTPEAADKDLVDKVLGYANGILSDAGIGEPKNYTEARSLKQKRLKTMFDFTSKKRASDEALAIQEMICKLIKEQHPEKSAQTNDEIMDALAIEAFLANARENPEERHPVLGKILSVNSEKETNNQTPFIENTVVQTLGLVDEIPTEKLVDVDDFLATLMIDGISNNNLQNIWTGMLEIKQREIDNFSNDKILDIMSGKSNDIRYGCFAFKNNGSDKVVLDIIHLPEKNKTLIIGDEISRVNVVRLKTQGITYIDRNEAKSASAVNNWINDIKGDTLDSLIEAVKKVNNLISSSVNLGKMLTKPCKERDFTNISQVNNFGVKELSQNSNSSDAKNSFFQIIQNITELSNSK